MEMTNNFNSSLIKNRIKMISKIKSSKFANYKYLIGVFTVVVLIVAFACEQKESLVPATQQEAQAIKIYFVGDKAKIEAGSADLDRLKELFSGDSSIKLVTDSLGNVFLEKSQIKGVILKKGELLPSSQPQNTLDGEPVFFIVETMPEFPGGETALRQFITNSVHYPEIAKENGIQGKVFVNFIVSKDGSVVGAKIARGVDPSLDKEALRVVSDLPKWKPGEQRGQKVNVSYTVPINFALQ